MAQNAAIHKNNKIHTFLYKKKEIFNNENIKNTFKHTFVFSLYTF